jgi:hypothetical protein
MTITGGWQPRGGNGQTPLTRGMTGDLWRATYKSLSYVIDGLIVRGKFTALTGKTGHGKTTVALSLAGHIANGIDFMGRETEQGHVALVLAENPVGTLHSYIAMVDSWPGSFDESYVHIFVYEERTPVDAIRSELNAYALSGGDDFKFSTIITDSASALFPGDEFNSNTQAMDFAAELRTLTTLSGDPAHLVLCHPNKAAKNPTELVPVGGGLFISQLDNNFTSWLDGDIVRIGHTKLRMPTWDAFEMRLVDTEAKTAKDAKNRPLRAAVAREISTEEAIQQDRQDRSDRDRILQAMYVHQDGAEVFKSAQKVGAAAGICMPAANKHHKTVQRARRAANALKAEKLIEFTNKHYLLTKKGWAYCATRFGVKQ